MDQQLNRYLHGDTGQFVSIVHHPITGAAFISYYDAINHDLRIAYQVPEGAGNCGPNNAWMCQLVDQEGDVGKFSSIDVVYVENIFPTPSYTQIGISYYDATNDALKYASGYYFILIDWTIYEVDDSAGNVSFGQYSSMKFNSNYKPQIAYYGAVLVTPKAGWVKYATFWGDGTGNCGEGNHWYCIVVDGMNGEVDYGKFVSLDIDYNDKVFIAYYNSAEENLMYAAYAGLVNDTCLNTGWYCVTVDNVGDVGRFVSIHARDNSLDKLRFAYYDNTEHEIRYAVTNSSEGFDTFAVDYVGNFSDHLGLSLSVDSQGYPIIAYMDASSFGTGSGLKIARPAVAFGKEGGNCGDIPPGSFLPFQYWQCTTIKPGNVVTQYAKFAAVSVSRTGLAMVAYYASDFTGRLMVAEQKYTIRLPLIVK